MTVALHPGLPDRDALLDHLAKTADLITVGNTQWLLVPISPADLEDLAMVGVELEDLEENCDREPEDDPPEDDDPGGTELDAGEMDDAERDF